MALLAEELVEEWLNRQGYFTIRGVKLGIDEIDILAVRFLEGGELKYRHIEVQASMRPVSYISRIPKAQQRLGKAPNSAARSESDLIAGVEEWVEKKFLKPKKQALMKQLAPARWSSELVLNNFKALAEVELIQQHGIKITTLSSILSELRERTFLIQSANGADFVDLMNMGAESP